MVNSQNYMSPVSTVGTTYPATGHMHKAGFELLSRKYLKAEKSGGKCDINPVHFMNTVSATLFIRPG